MNYMKRDVDAVMNKRITITLTEDQAKALSDLLGDECERLHHLVLNYEIDKVTQKKYGFLKRVNTIVFCAIQGIRVS